MVDQLVRWYPNKVFIFFVFSVYEYDVCSTEGHQGNAFVLKTNTVHELEKRKEERTE